MARFSATETFSNAFSLVLRNFATFLGTQGVFILAAAVVSLAATLVVETNVALLDAWTGEPESFEQLVLLLPALMLASGAGLVSLVLSIIGSGIGIVVSDALYEGRSLTLAEAWERLRPRLLNYVGTMLLIILAIGGILLAGAVTFFLVVTLLAALVGAVYLFLHWAVAGPVSILETRSATQNLSASGAYTRGSKGGVFLTFLLVVLVAIGVSLVFIVPIAVFQGLAEFVSPTAPVATGWVVAEWAGSTAVELFISPLGSAAIVLVYRHLRAPPPPPPVVPSPEPPAPAPPVEPGGG